MSGEPLLRVDSVARRYRIRSSSAAVFVGALSGVTFDVRSGEVLAIAGESGSGKSTLARIVAGLDRPDSGSVAIGGRNLDDLRGKDLRHTRRRVQLVLQDTLLSLDPRMSARQSIAEAARGVDAERRLSAACDLSRVDPSILDRLPHALSGGERQRVAIARALAADPEILVLDEALSGVDLIVRGEIARNLRGWVGEKRRAILLVTHDLVLIRALSDRLLLLHGGALEELGPARDVLESPIHPCTRRLLEAARLDLRTRAGAPVAEGSAAAGGCYRGATLWREVQPGRWVREPAMGPQSG